MAKKKSVPGFMKKDTSISKQAKTEKPMVGYKKPKK